MANRGEYVDIAAPLCGGSSNMRVGAWREYNPAKKHAHHQTSDLKRVGVGYRAAPKGSDLELQLGFSHPVIVKAPDGIEFDVPEPTRIIVSGTNKQVVGQVAADIRSHRKPEPYKGKGVRYLGEYVARKAGKAAK